MEKQTKTATAPQTMILYADTQEVISACPNNNFHHVFTSIPDMDENEFETVKEYTEFFENMVGRCFEKCKKDGYIIFLQTDSKVNGYWLDKSFMIYDVARILEMKLMWHKIVLNKETGKCDNRPTYAHLLCFTAKGKVGGKKSLFPDVLPVSNKIWKNATPDGVCEAVMDFIVANTPADVDKHKQIVFDPFCGHGTNLKEAKKRGFSVFGIDNNEECVKKCEEVLKD